MRCRRRQRLTCGLERWHGPRSAWLKIRFSVLGSPHAYPFPSCGQGSHDRHATRCEGKEALDAGWLFLRCVAPADTTRRGGAIDISTVDNCIVNRCRRIPAFVCRNMSGRCGKRQFNEYRMKPEQTLLTVASMAFGGLQGPRCQCDRQEHG